MTIFRFPVTRTVTQTAEAEVEAKTIAEAHRMFDPSRHLRPSFTRSGPWYDLDETASPVQLPPIIDYSIQLSCDDVYELVRELASVIKEDKDGSFTIGDEATDLINTLRHLPKR